MSRWADAFRNHPFQSEWIELKNSLNGEQIDDPTVKASVEELARLKKIIKYIDGLLQGLDPELIPVNALLSTSVSQAASCRNTIQQYKSSRSVAHLQQANEHADNLLSYFRPYLLAPQRARRVLQEAFEAYAKTINEHATSFGDKAAGLALEIAQYRAESKAIHDQIKEINTSIEEFEADLFGQEEGDNGIQGRVEAFVKNLEEKNRGINDFYIQTLRGNEENPSTKKEIAEAKASMLKIVDESRAMLKEGSEKVEALKAFHIKVYGAAVEDDGSDGIERGILADFESRIVKLAEFEKKQNERYLALNDQINSLLPAATSTGLAAAYGEMKKSFFEPIKHMNWLFYGAIGAFLFLSIAVTMWESGQMNLANPNDWDGVLRGLIHKLPFYVPLVWLAFYATKRRSEFQRLHQEYAHKEALARSYESYKKQLEQLDDENKEMQKALIMEAVSAIAYNASVTLDGKHGDNMPTQSIFAEVIKKIVPNRQ